MGQSTFQLSFNGEQCVASEMGKHNSGSKSVMNCATFEDIKGKKMYIVAGLDDHSQLYFVSKKFEIARSLSSSDQNENTAGDVLTNFWVCNLTLFLQSIYSRTISGKKCEAEET